MEDVVDCIIRNNFQSDTKNILNYYFCTMHELKTRNRWYYRKVKKIKCLMQKGKTIKHLSLVDKNIEDSKKNFLKPTSFYGLYVYY